MLPKDTRSVDVVFFKELAEGWYAITNQKSGVGFGMAWDKSVFKYLWMWQVYGGHNDYPWYGRTYNVALGAFHELPPGRNPERDQEWHGPDDEACPGDRDRPGCRRL